MPTTHRGSSILRRLFMQAQICLWRVRARSINLSKLIWGQKIFNFLRTPILKCDNMCLYNSLFSLQPHCGQAHAGFKVPGSSHSLKEFQFELHLSPYFPSKVHHSFVKKSSQEWPVKLSGVIFLKYFCKK